MIETRKKITGIVAVLILCGALISIVKTCRDTSDRQLADAETALRRVGAEETVKLLGENSRVVLLTIKGVGGKQRESVEQWREILEKSGVEVQAVETIDPADYRMADFELMSAGMPGDWVIQQLETHADADAVISLLGPPSFSDDHFESVPESRPKMILLSPIDIPYMLVPFFQEDIIQLALVARMVGFWDDQPAKGNYREIFDQHFQVVTTDSWQDVLLQEGFDP